jgi:LmbE family N-acetylglucosaminyl deacetylase
MDSDSSRRTFVARSLAGLGALALPGGEAPASPSRPLSVVCVGGHPDDPETGCGGTLAAYAELGHRATVVYLTRGERGIPGRSLAEAAAIRTAEATEACRILGARAVFAGQIDGDTEVSGPRAGELARLLEAESPDIVFTHWPLDTHPDHQAASLLAFRAWLSSRRRFALYFFEVNTGHQTMGFAPTDYVDVTARREKKKGALLAHRSQHGDAILRDHVEIMEAFRGREVGVAAAEGFVRVARVEAPASL